MLAGDFEGGLELAKKGRLPVHVVEGAMEEAVQAATRDGDLQRVERVRCAPSHPSTRPPSLRALVRARSRARARARL